MSSISEAQIRDAIRDILKGADLSSLSSKLVRKQLEEKFRADLTSRKQEVDDILMALINAMGEEDKVKGEPCSDTESNDDNEDAKSKSFASIGKNGSFASSATSATISNIKRSHSPSDSGTNSDLDADALRSGPKQIPAAKKPRGSGAQAVGGEPSTSDDDVDDETYARKLQQQELRMRPRQSKQKTEKKSRSAKSTPGEGGASGKRKTNSLYSQECFLSSELAAVMGTDRLARKDVVSRMWKIFKERDLMDPRNKRYVVCDEQLEKVFKCKKFKAFSMMKHLKTHIKDAKDVL